MNNSIGIYVSLQQKKFVCCVWFFENYKKVRECWIFLYGFLSQFDKTVLSLQANLFKCVRELYDLLIDGWVALWNSLCNFYKTQNIGVQMCTNIESYFVLSIFMNCCAFHKPTLYGKLWPLQRFNLVSYALILVLMLLSCKQINVAMILKLQK